MLRTKETTGIDPPLITIAGAKFINSSFDKHMKIDGRTKKVLFHAWMNGSWNKRRMNDKILSNNSTTADSFFKPYLITRGKCNTKKEDEQSQTKRKYCNASESINEQPNKRMCKAEKFEAIQCSLRTNEEYIAIRRCKYDIWERNKDNMLLVPSCCVIFDLEPFLFDFIFNSEIFKSFPCLSLSSLPSCDLVS
ncbi:hypothetical protein Tco_1289011 [Tanacetum coccineum]